MNDAIVGRYPTECEGDVLLADGEVAHVRPIRPDDGERLVEFHEGLSSESIRRRFFSAHPHLRPKEVERFTHVDYRGRLALVVESGRALLAVARYEAEPGTDQAEVAFVVNDAVQGKGMGTLLLEHLAAAARRRGFGRFVAQTLGGNHAMVDVFARSGFTSVFGWSDGLVDVAFPIAPSEPYLQAVTDRYLHAVAARAARSGPGPAVGEVTEALALAARTPQAVVAAVEVDQAPRPRRFFSLARVIAQRLPVVACVAPGATIVRRLCRQAGVEVASTPAELDARAAALTALVRAGEWRPPDTGSIPDLAGCDIAAARAAIDAGAGGTGEPLAPEGVTAVLDAYRIVLPRPGPPASLWTGELPGRGLCLQVRRERGDQPWWSLPLTDRSAGDVADEVAPDTADRSTYADVALRLTRLVDDQADLLSVEVPLDGTPAAAQWGSARDSADDPFLSWLRSPDAP